MWPLQCIMWVRNCVPVQAWIPFMPCNGLVFCIYGASRSILIRRCMSDCKRSDVQYIASARNIELDCYIQFYPGSILRHNQGLQLQYRVILIPWNTFRRENCPLKIPGFQPVTGIGPFLAFGRALNTIRSARPRCEWWLYRSFPDR
jgi:hypothetical protein